MADALHMAGELAKDFERPDPLPTPPRRGSTELSGSTRFADPTIRAPRRRPRRPIRCSLRDRQRLRTRHAGFAQELSTLARPRDALLAISTSGRSPNLLNAVYLAARPGRGDRAHRSPCESAHSPRRHRHRGHQATAPLPSKRAMSRSTTTSAAISSICSPSHDAHRRPEDQPGGSTLALIGLGPAGLRAFGVLSAPMGDDRWGTNDRRSSGKIALRRGSPWRSGRISSLVRSDGGRWTRSRSHPARTWSTSAAARVRPPSSWPAELRPAARCWVSTSCPRWSRRRKRVPARGRRQRRVPRR